MQKQKKPLKKQAANAAKASDTGKSRAGSLAAAKKPVQAAKKSAPAGKKPVAKKAAPPPAKKVAAKKPAPAPAKKAAAPAPAKAAPKAPVKAPVKAAELKDAKKKAAAPAAPVKGVKTAPVKPAPVAPAKPVEAQVKAQPKTLAAKEPAKAKAPPNPEKAAKAENAKNKRDEAAAAEQAPADEEIILTDADGRRYCRVRECDQASTVDGYCRYHYLLFWKNIQNRKKILAEGKLERYVEELTARYPDKFLELLRKDMRSEKDFMAAIQELEIDEAANEGEFEEEAQNYLDEVRGMSSEPSNEREEDF